MTIDFLVNENPLHVKVKIPPQKIKRTSYFKSLNKENHTKSLAIIIF